MLHSTLVLILASGAPAAAPTAEIETAVSETLLAEPASALEMYRLAAYLRSVGKTDASDDWFDAALRLDPDVAGRAASFSPSRGAFACGAVGPDLTVAMINDMQAVTHVGAPQDGVSAFGIGLSVCNIGDTGVDWVSSTPRHPIVAPNLYRVMDGRFEQIGMGWVKHEFFALGTNLCCTCTGQITGELAAGCSDVFTSALAATQNLLGPRSQVNPTTGDFMYPFTAPPIASTLDRRMRVDDADINPAENPGAVWLAEMHYIAPDDAAAGNDLNNAGWRDVSFVPSGMTFNAIPNAASGSGEHAIMAWPAISHGAVVDSVPVPGDGVFHVGHNVIDNGDGTWRYEYAVHNMNSDRAAREFSVPVGAGVTLSDVGFNDVDSHSGEPYDTTDWEFTAAAGRATWTMPAFTPEENANALRWGTAYSFWFTADAAPRDVAAELLLFKDGPVPSIPGVASVVRAPEATVCPADLDASGSVDSGDLAELLAGWGGPGAADLNASGTVDASDLAILLAAWGDC